jgi:hypothetical protein
MTKIVLIIVGVVVAGVIVVVGLFLAPIMYDGFRSASQKRALQTRSDYPQIAAACVSLARSITNDSVLLKPSDPVVPAALRALSPRYISAYTNFITLEFHGGFDHYGYRVQQSDTDARLWTISYYTEQGQRLLTTITND